MHRFRISLLLISVALTAGCASQPASEARLPVYDAAPPSGDSATITGSKKKPGLFVTPRETFVSAVDGTLILEDETVTPLTPGSHSIVVGLLHLERYLALPFRLEAEAGRRYVVTWDERDDARSDLFYIADLETGQAVTGKSPGIRRNHTERFREPAASAPHATMRGSTTSGLLDRDFAHLVSVDGLFVQETSNTLFGPEYDYTAIVRLDPGTRALGIGYQVTDNYNKWILPIMFEVEAGRSYIVKFDSSTKAFSGKRWRTFTTWIEDEKSGGIVTAPIDIPIQRLFF